MLTGTTLDRGKNIIETFKLLKQKGIPINPQFSSKTKRLLQGMLMFSVEKRTGCEQVLQEIERIDSSVLSQMNPEANDSKHISCHQPRILPL